MAVEFIPTQTIEARAAALLAQYHPSGNVPIPIDEIVEFGLRINVVPVPSLHQDLRVDGFITSDLTEIYVDDFVFQDRLNRFRFTQCLAVVKTPGKALEHLDALENFRLTLFSKTIENKQPVFIAGIFQLTKIGDVQLFIKDFDHFGPDTGNF